MRSKRNNPTPGLRKMIRKSVGISKSPRPVARTPILKRPVKAPVVRTPSSALGDSLAMADMLREAIAKAVSGITAEVESLKAQVETANVSIVRSKPIRSRAPVDYSLLSELTRRGILEGRGQPVDPRETMIMRVQHNTRQHATGRKIMAETVSSAVRRSVGLSPIKPRRNTRGFTVRSAIALSERQSFNAIAHVQQNQIGSRIHLGGYKSIFGGSFATAAARDNHDAACAGDLNKSIPLMDRRS